MSVTIKPVGPLREYTAGAGEVYMPCSLTVREALEQLGIPTQLVALVVVNGEAQPKDYRLEEGDCVQLLGVIGGG